MSAHAFALRCASRRVPTLGRSTRKSSVALVSVADAQTPAQPAKHECGVMVARARARGTGHDPGCFVTAYSKLTADPVNVPFLTFFVLHVAAPA
jgi:hypothetical protein